MPSLLKHMECSACGHRYHFCSSGDELALGRQYASVCPETGGKDATLRAMAVAEFVHTSPQGAVALTPVDDEASSRSGQESAEDTATKPLSPAWSGATSAAHGLPGMERKVPEMGQAVQGLATRLGELAEKVASAVSDATAPSSDAPPSAAANEPEAGPTRLQEVLPKVKELAGKVGGWEQHSDIVETLKQTKE